MNARPDTTDAAGSAVGTEVREAGRSAQTDLDRAVADVAAELADAESRDWLTLTVGVADLRLILAALRERGEALGEARELMGAMLANLDALDDYMKQPERGGYGVECAVCMNEWLEPADREVMDRARSAPSPPEGE